MKSILVARKLLTLGQPINNPFSAEHEWLFNLLQYYKNQDVIDLNLAYKKFTQNTDYYTVRQEYMIYLLEDVRQYVDIKKFKNCDEVILQVIHLWKTDKLMKNTTARSAAWSAESAESAAWSAAESAAWSAAWSAARSAESAAWSAAESAAWSAAESAAWSAARSAESAAWSAAESAAWSAESAARSAAWSAESAARSAALQKSSNKLLEIIEKNS